MDINSLPIIGYISRTEELNIIKRTDLDDINAYLDIYDFYLLSKTVDTVTIDILFGIDNKYRNHPMLIRKTYSHYI